MGESAAVRASGCDIINSIHESWLDGPRANIRDTMRKQLFGITDTNVTY